MACHLLPHIPQERLPNTIILNPVKEGIDLKFLSQLFGKGDMSLII